MTALRPLLALRLAVRGLIRDPSTTVLGVVILAVGLALPAIFSSLLVGAVRPLPVPDGQAVVRVDVVQPRQGGRELGVLPRELDALQGTPGLEALGGFRAAGATLADPVSGPVRVELASVSVEVLALLGVAPEVGRWPEGPGEILLGRTAAERLEAGGGAGALGRGVRLDGVPHTVVGVMPEGFGFPFHEEAWTLLDPAAEGPVTLVGRLAANATEESAQAALDARWAAADDVRDDERSGGTVLVRGFTRGRGEGGEAVAFLGLVLVALSLLLIACSNVANLLLARAARRVRALGIQSALGAGRGQVALQLMAEATLVAAAGGVAGLALAWVGVAGVQRVLAGEHFGYFWMRMAVDGPVVAFTAVLVMGTALVAGLLPVARILRLDIQQVLKEEGAGGLEGGGAWARRFVSAQLALSCGALVAAALASMSVGRSLDVAPGLPAEEVLVARASSDAAEVGAPLLQALAERPEVAAAAVARGIPGFREGYGRLEVEGEEVARAEDRPVAVWNDVTPSYFQVLEIGLREGRLPTAADVGKGVGVVSVSFARAWLEGRALGRRVRVRPGEEDGAWVRVVGVVDDVELLEGQLRQQARLYVPADPGVLAGGHVLVRTRGTAAGQASFLRRVAAGVDPGFAFDDVRTLAGTYEYLVRAPRMLALLAAVGGLAGLLVAVVGLYGLLAFRVREQRRALGVRRALGADGRTVARTVLGWAARQLLPAVAVGLTLAWLASPILTAMLLGSDPRAPLTYLVVGVGFLLTGLAAALVPALRAASVDPARVLRGE